MSRYSRIQTFAALGLGLTLSWTFPILSYAESDHATAVQYLKDAAQYYSEEQYFKTARYAYAAMDADPSIKGDAYAWITAGLTRAGLRNAAAYFFIRTLQTGNRTAIRSALTHTQDLIIAVGADLLRKHLNRHTRYEDYDSINRSAYLYALGKDALLSGDELRAVGYLNGVDSSSPLYPFALQLRGAAHAILGRTPEAVSDFRKCAARSDDVARYGEGESRRLRLAKNEASDLRARCQAGEARTLYQSGDFEGADRAYDHISKQTFVWTDILFEHAWNAFALNQYNRTLGKLVSYKSPALEFMFNTENDVLRAQSFLAMCLYSDANTAINDFNSSYAGVGVSVKEFVERNSSNLPAFYELGKRALRAPIYTKNKFDQLLNRFVRGPYFQNLVEAERQIALERVAVQRFDLNQPGVSHRMGEGFPGFIDEVLKWRYRTVFLLGGAFVKNSLMDYHAALLDDFEKMAFIKLEMLKFAKEKLINKNAVTEGRGRGSQQPSRRDDQYRWSFNGEFWNDELGDYVFALESECKS